MAEGLPPAPDRGPAEAIPAREYQGQHALLEGTPPVCGRCGSRLPPRWVLLPDGRGCCVGCARSRSEGTLQEPA